MCVLAVKTDRDGKPNRAKSRIVVLGNHEDRVYSKSKRYAPVLKYDSLRLLTAKAVSQRRVLQQATARMRSAMLHYPKTKPLSSALQQETPPSIMTNSGSSAKRCMVYDAAPNTGTT